MKTKNVISNGNMAEFFRIASIPGSHINEYTVKAFIEGRNPFKKELFEFNNLLYNQPGLTIIENSYMQSIRNANKTPKKYVSTKSLEKILFLSREHYRPSIKIYINTKKEKKELRVNTTDISQIELLIEKQWGGKDGELDNIGGSNFFYVLGENEELIVLILTWNIYHSKWIMEADSFSDFNIKGDKWIESGCVFSNMSL